MKEMYKINVEDMERFESLVEKLNKRAVKCGVSEITYEVGKAHYEEKQGVMCKLHDVVVTFEDVIKIDGYEFVATITHTYGNGNIVRLAPSVDNVDKKYYTINGVCEHCNTNRRRKETVLLQDENGKIIQVGKTCLKDFIGHNVNDKLKYIEQLNMFEENLNAMDSCISDIKYMKVKKVLELSNAIIKAYGYVKTRDEFGNNNDNSTKALVYMAYRESYSKRWEKELKEIIERVFEEDYKDNEVDEMIDCLNKDTNDSNYIQNLKVLVNNECIDDKELGYVVSLPTYYHRKKMEQRKAEKIKEESVSEWVGEEKQRMTLDITLQKIRGFETMYGYMYVYEFIDGNNNVLIWKTSNEQEFNEGDVIKATFTIKNHEEFRGVKQTNILRLVVKKEVV